MDATNNFNEVSLSNVGHGSAIELFDDELKAVLENIADPNTEPDAVRQVILTVKIKPTKERNNAQVLIEAKSKLAPNKSASASIIISRKGKIVKAFESKAVEQLLPFETNIKAINGDDE